MERITISVSEDFAAELAAFMERNGYENRSEAVRDLARLGLNQAQNDSALGSDCVATLSYVFSHHTRELPKRLTNAHHALEERPQPRCVRLTARADGAWAQIEVADNGPGIPEAVRSRVFDPFFTRFDVSRHSSGVFEFDRRGLGLGLAVVKAFVEMHGGRVKAESQVGKGSTFTIMLPPQEQ